MIATYPGGATSPSRAPQGRIVGIGDLGQRAGLLKGGEHAVGGVLGLLDVGLVERVDLKAPAGDRHGQLRQQEQAPQIGRPAGRES